MNATNAQSQNPNGTCPHGTKIRRGCVDCADVALVNQPVTTWHAPIKHLPGVERVYFGRCFEHPTEEYDHHKAGCAHWHVDTAIICVAPCFDVPENEDDLPVALLHEYAHFLVGGDTSGNSIIIAHGRKWRDKFCDLLDLHGYERPVPLDAHTGQCSDDYAKEVCTSDDVITRDFEIDASAMIWNIFESETRLRNSTPEATIEDFMASYASREPSDRMQRAFGSRLTHAGIVTVPVSLTLTEATVNAFVQAATEVGIEPEYLVQRFMEQSAYTL